MLSDNRENRETPCPHMIDEFDKHCASPTCQWHQCSPCGVVMNLDPGAMNWMYSDPGKYRQ